MEDWKACDHICPFLSTQLKVNTVINVNTIASINTVLFKNERGIYVYCSTSRPQTAFTKKLYKLGGDHNYIISVELCALFQGIVVFDAP